MSIWTAKVDGVDKVMADHINRLQNEKLDKDLVNFIFPEDYGALGGGHDDTAAIQAALNAAGSIPVLVSHSSFLTSKLTISSNQTLVLDVGVVLTGAAGLNDDLLVNSNPFGNTNIEVIGGTWHGNGANNTTDNHYVMLFTNVTNLTLRDFFVIQTAPTTGDVGIDHTQWSIDLLGCSHVTVDIIDLTNASSQGLMVTNGDHVTINESNFHDIYNSGVDLTDAPYSKVTNNLFSNTGADCSVLGFNARHGVVSGNIIEGGTGLGITIGHPAHPADYTSVIGNTVKDNDHAGIFVQNAIGASVTGNTLYNNGKSGASQMEAGIWIASSSAGCVVVGNTLFSNFTGIYIAGPETSVTGNNVESSGDWGIFVNSNNNIVDGNIVKNGADIGIYLNSIVSNIISNNRCFDDQTPKTQTYGIYSYNAGTTHLGNIIANNNVSGNLVLGYQSAMGDIASNNILDDANPMQSTVLTNDIATQAGSDVILRFLQAQSTGAKGTGSAEIRAIKLNTFIYGDAATLDAGLAFCTEDDNILGERVRITNDGKVGINDIAPAEKLDVAGNANVTGVYKVADVQIIGAQGAAVADATGAGDVVAQLNALLARVRAHGIIDT
jgi:parallel beta-helix repeat protein